VSEHRGSGSGDQGNNARDERALWALILLLGVLAVWQVSRDDAPDLPDSVATPMQQQTPRQTSYKVPDYADVLERPLFHPSRRRVPDPEPASPEPAPPRAAPRDGLDGWILVGLIDLGERTVALLRQGANGPVQTLRTGDQLGEWTLVGAAGRGAALFERDEEQLELTMPGRDDINSSQANPR
jgi:hypothetical protein